MPQNTDRDWEAELNEQLGEYCPIVHKRVVPKKYIDFISNLLISERNRVIEEVKQFIDHEKNIMSACGRQECDDSINAVYFEIEQKLDSLSPTKE